MKLSTRKAAFGIAITFLMAGIAAPVAYWFLTIAVDNAFNLKPVLDAPYSLILAGAMILIGAFWLTWAYSYLHFVGEGMPLEVFGRPFHPTRTLVTTGPYAYSRNPMVLGLLFLLLGVALLRGSISGLIMVPIIGVIIALYIKTFEEKELVRRFGSNYEKYRRNVPMIIPRMSSYIHEPAAKGA